MSVPTTANFKTIMAADTGAGGVATLLTGGIFTIEESGRFGISPEGTPTAFDTTTHLLKPTALINLRDPVPDGQISDDMTQDVSLRAVAEIWLMTDGSDNFAVTTTVRNRLFTLFHGTRVPATSGPVVRWLMEVRNRRLNEAWGRPCLERIDFLINTLRA